MGSLLSLNFGKSESIVISNGERQRRLCVDIGKVTLVGNGISVSRVKKTLGITIDSTMSFDLHVAINQSLF